MYLYTKYKCCIICIIVSYVLLCAYYLQRYAASLMIPFDNSSMLFGIFPASLNSYARLENQLLELSFNSIRAASNTVTS